NHLLIAKVKKTSIGRALRTTGWVLAVGAIGLAVLISLDTGDHGDLFWMVHDAVIFVAWMLAVALGVGAIVCLVVARKLDPPHPSPGDDAGPGPRRRLVVASWACWALGGAHILGGLGAIAKAHVWFSKHDEAVQYASGVASLCVGVVLCAAASALP